MPDETLTQANATRLASKLARQLAAMQMPSNAPNASALEREAARWLYERLADYRGMLYKRALTRSVEYIAGGPYGTSFAGASGWYYRCEANPTGWQGPYRTHAEAVAARDQHLPRKVADATIAKVLANPEFFT